MKNLVTEYVSDLMSGVERRQAERRLDPPEQPELTEATRRAAERGFDAGDALALDWLSDHHNDKEVRAFTTAAWRRCGAGNRLKESLMQPRRNFEQVGARARASVDAEQAQFDAHADVRAAFVEAMAEEYE